MVRAVGVVTARYDFLILAVLFLVPGAAIAFARPDLRPLMARMSIASLPFAATECLFYPDYWRPRFLFDLADTLGFGVEDVLFVVGLSAFACTGYAVVARRTLDVAHAAAPRALARALGMILVSMALTLSALAFRVPVIYAAVLAMTFTTATMLVRRRDLAVPAALGSVTSGAVYLALCLVFETFVPGVFTSTWRPSVLLPGVLVLGVPADELLYGLAAGAVATVFPAFVFEAQFRPLRAH